MSTKNEKATSAIAENDTLSKNNNEKLNNTEEEIVNENENFEEDNSMEEEDLEEEEEEEDFIEEEEGSEEENVEENEENCNIEEEGETGVNVMAYCGLNNSTCGYCKKKEKSSTTYGAYAIYLNNETYQDLIDMGWRRSGEYCYKPLLHSSCCSQNTIRLRSTEFEITKSQKKSLKKMEKYLTTIETKDDSTNHTTEGNNEKDKSNEESKDNKENNEKTTEKMEISNQSSNKTNKKRINFKFPTVNSKESLIKWFESIKELNKMGGKKLEIKTVKSSFEQNSYQLFKKYQVNVHKEKENEVHESGYENFLVNTPLSYKKNKSPYMYGSYHQKYYIDDKLVAVGVIDILPKCLSSVYFLYDTDYAFLSLGVFSALQEIYFSLVLNKYLPNLLYYYLGFYIHSCPKMVYKAQYTPSDLLDPVYYYWVPLKYCLYLYDRFKDERYIPFIDRLREMEKESKNSDNVVEDPILKEAFDWLNKQNVSCPFDVPSPIAKINEVNLDDSDVQNILIQKRRQIFLYNVNNLELKKN